MASRIQRAVLKVLSIHDMVYQGTNGWIGHRLPVCAAEPVVALDRSENGCGKDELADLREGRRRTI